MKKIICVLALASLLGTSHPVMAQPQELPLWTLKDVQKNSCNPSERLFLRLDSVADSNTLLLRSTMGNYFRIAVRIAGLKKAPAHESAMAERILVKQLRRKRLMVRVLGEEEDGVVRGQIILENSNEDVALALLRSGSASLMDKKPDGLDGLVWDVYQETQATAQQKGLGMWTTSDSAPSE